MKTDDLVSLLAADTVAVPRHAAARQIAMAVAAGAAITLLAMLATIGARPDLQRAAHDPMFWMKVTFPAMVALGSFATLGRLARPGVNVGLGPAAIALPIFLVWTMSIWAYLGAPPAARAAMVWGETWKICTLSIVMISTPVVAAAFLALRRLAPTRPARAGACAGWLGGAVGAVVYALRCPETALPFMAIWYVAGMAVPAAIGAALGRRFLRW